MLQWRLATFLLVSPEKHLFIGEPLSGIFFLQKAFGFYCLLTYYATGKHSEMTEMTAYFSVWFTYTVWLTNANLNVSTSTPQSLQLYLDLLKPRIIQCLSFIICDSVPCSSSSQLCGPVAGSGFALPWSSSHGQYDPLGTVSDESVLA